MTADPRVLVHARRRALWMFLFAGVLLHASLCPSGVGADGPRCAAHGSAVPAVAEANQPCAPPVHPPHHPCGALTHAQQRTAGSGQDDAGLGCPSPATAVDGHAGPAPTCPRWRSSRPPAARSGAGLLIDLCSART